MTTEKYIKPMNPHYNLVVHSICLLITLDVQAVGVHNAIGVDQETSALHISLFFNNGLLQLLADVAVHVKALKPNDLCHP